MCVFYNRSLTRSLDLCRASHQRADGTSFRLALGHNDHGLALDQLSAPAALAVHALVHLFALFQLLWRPFCRQSAALGRQAWRHERRARQDEADGAAVDSDGRERLREAVDELEMRDQRAGGVVLLVEDGRAVDDVERVSVGELHAGQGGLFGENFLDVRVQKGVCCQ